MQQAVNILIQDAPTPPDTGVAGFLSQSFATPANTVIALSIIVTIFIAITFFIRRFRKTHSSKHLVRNMLALLLIPAVTVLAASTSNIINATSSITNTLDPINITITRSATQPVTEVTTATTTVTTDNATGYTLGAELDGVDADTIIAINAGITTKLNSELLSTTAVDVLMDDTGNSPSTFIHELSVTVPANIATGTYTMNILYGVTENAPDAPRTMQAMTSSYCDTLTLNETIELTDARNNQEYMIRKLADDKCWMINNLMYGGGTTSISTGLDTGYTGTDVIPVGDGTSGTISDQTIGGASSYTDAYYYDTTGQCFDVNQDWDCEIGNGIDVEITNDDIDSPYFAGYLYNWCAATGTNSATCTDESTEPENNAGTSICPLGWRLPTIIDNGLTTIDDWMTDIIGNLSSEFSLLNAKMAGFANNQDPIYLDSYWEYYEGWQFSGPFRGIFSGYWSGGFSDQGNRGSVWSSSSLDGASGAFLLNFYLSDIRPDNSGGRGEAVAVRCVL